MSAGYKLLWASATGDIVLILFRLKRPYALLACAQGAEPYNALASFYGARAARRMLKLLNALEARENRQIVRLCQDYGAYLALRLQERRPDLKKIMEKITNEQNRYSG